MRSIIASGAVDAEEELEAEGFVMKRKGVMKSAKKTWKFSFSKSALDRIERLPAPDGVEGEEGTFIPMSNAAWKERRAEVRAVKEAVRAAIWSRRLARGEILISGTGTYKEEGDKITIKFDPPAAETS